MSTRRKGRTVRLILVTVILITIGAVAWPWVFPGGSAGAERDRATVKVERKDLVVGVSQPGQIEASNKVIVRCQVRRDTKIKWIIDEGSFVEPGELLVKLDDTALIDRRTESEQRVDSARSSLVAAQVALKNTESQAQSDVQKARLDLEFAKLEVEKYLQGEYPQQVMSAEADIEIARETSERATFTASQSKKLLEKQYITNTEYEADLASANKARLDWEIAKEKLRVLNDYTFVMEKRRLESAVEQADAELERVQNKAQADVEKAKADLANAQSDLTRAEIDLREDSADVEHCQIYAPVGGRVVYAPQSRRGRPGEPLAEGSEVDEDDPLIHIPESGAMSVKIKIEESQRDKVKEGLQVRITGPNLPETGLLGTLTYVAEYLDPSGWWNNNQKVYSANVEIDTDQDVSMLRTGMNCKTEIIVAFYDDALTLPVQCVLLVDGQHTVFVPDGAGVRPVKVKVGLDDGSRVRIIEGIAEGTEVVLEPPLELATKTDAGRKLRRSNPGLESTEGSNDSPGDRQGGERRRGMQGGGDGEGGSRPNFRGGNREGGRGERGMNRGEGGPRWEGRGGRNRGQGGAPTGTETPASGGSESPASGGNTGEGDGGGSAAAPTTDTTGGSEKSTP